MRPTLVIPFVLAAILGCEPVACSPVTGPPDAEQARRPRVSLDLHPLRLGIGEIAKLTISVRTPPDHRVPLPDPPELSGLHIVRFESDPPRKQEREWLHSIRVDLRAEEAGLQEWPETSILVLSGEASTAAGGRGARGTKWGRVTKRGRVTEQTTEGSDGAIGSEGSFDILFDVGYGVHLVEVEVIRLHLFK